jgi:dTDP-glucose 4,6-dehydratase/UDP-glucose 4-epimerase
MLSCLNTSHHLLILGATGLFGRHLLPKLFTHFDNFLNKPKLTIVTRSKSQALALFPSLETYSDLIEMDFLLANNITKGNNYTHILHMANTSASETFSGANQYSKYQLLLNSSIAIRNLIMDGGVKRIVFTSSGIAYGETSNYSESQNSALNHLHPSSSLAFGKLTAEYILSNSTLDLDCELSIARCFSFISPFLPVDIHYAIGNFIKNAVHNEDIIVNSDGRDIRSYQNVEDTVDWLIFLLTTKNPIPILNVGDDKAISIADLAFRVKKVLNSNSTVNIKNNKTLDHNQRRFNYVPNISLARSMGLTNHWDLNSSIEQLSLRLNDQLKHPKGTNL